MASTRTRGLVGGLGRDRVVLVTLGVLAVYVLAYLWPALGLLGVIQNNNFPADLVWLVLFPLVYVMRG